MRKTEKSNGTEKELNSKFGGFLPPQAIELEKVVLGAMLIEKSAYIEISDVLRPDVFYKESHIEIFRAIQSLAMKNDPIDIKTVMHELKVAGKLDLAGGAYYLTELTDGVVSSSNIEVHARILVEKYAKRELIKQSSQIIQKCYQDENDVFEILTENDVSKDNVLDVMITRKERSSAEILRETIEEMEHISKQPNGLTGIPSGFHEIDMVTNGFQRSDLNIVAARPAMGKTAFFMTCAINAVNAGYKVGVFSLEMSSKQLMKRNLSSVAEVELNKIINSRLLNEYDWARINKANSKLYHENMFFDDPGFMSLVELMAKARRMKRKYGIDILFLDYLQLVKNEVKGRNREQEISSISRALKGLAKELDIPVVALSQLSRKCEERPGHAKRPILSDLRESGAIEQDADVIYFLFRPEYYGLTEDENGHPTAGLAEVIIAKNRHGEIGDFPLRFVGKFTKFCDIDPYEYGSVQNQYDAFAGMEPNENFKL